MIDLSPWNEALILALIEKDLLSCDSVTGKVTGSRNQVALLQQTYHFYFSVCRNIDNGIVASKENFHSIFEAIVAVVHFDKDHPSQKQKLIDAIQEVEFDYPDMDELLKMLTFVESYNDIAKLEASVTGKCTERIKIKAPKPREEMVPDLFPRMMDRLAEYDLGLKYDKKYYMQHKDGQSYIQVAHRFA